MSLYTHWNGQNKKQLLERMWRDWNPHLLLVGVMVHFMCPLGWALECQISG